MARKKHAPPILVPKRYENDVRSIALLRMSDARPAPGQEKKISDEDQDYRIAGLEQSKGLERVAIFNERGISGDNDRELLDEALALIERHEAAWLVVFRVDRLGRDAMAIHESMDRIRKAGGCLLIVDPLVDSSTHAGRLIITIMGEVAVAEREKIATNWGNAQDHAWRHGKYPGDIPFGLRNPTPEEVLAQAGTPEPGHPLLQHVPEQVEVIRVVAKERLAGASWPAVARRFTELSGGAGRRTKKGRQVASWSPAGVRQLLNNPAMGGDVSYGGRYRAGAHEPIISPADLNAIAGSSTRPKYAHDEAAAVLVGLLRCANCRYTLHYWRGTYRCRGNHGPGTCPNPVEVRAADLEPMIEGAAFELHAEKLRGAMSHLAEAGLSLEAVDASLADWKVRRRQFMANLSALGINVQEDPDAREEFESLEHEGRELASERQTVERVMTPSGDGAALSFRAVYDGESLTGKNLALRSVLDCVFVGDGRPYIYGKGTAPLKQLPGKGRSVPFAPFVRPQGPDQVGPLPAAGVEHPAV